MNLSIFALCCSVFLSSGSLFGDQELIPPQVAYPDYAVQTQTVSGGDSYTTIQVLTSSANSSVDTSAIEAQLQEQLLTSSANSAALLEELQAMAAYQDQAFSSVSSGNASLLAELQAISSGQDQAAENYLTSAIVDVMDRVVRSHPFCRYIGYRTSVNNATDGTLVYGVRSDASPGTVTIYDGYKIDYYRYSYWSGNQTHYEYRYTVTPVDEYTIDFGPNTLVYTNALSGYPALGVNYTGYLIVGLVFIAFLAVLLRRH